MTIQTRKARTKAGGGLPSISLPVDVQQTLDDLLAGNPDMQKYVTKLWYIPEGTAPPPDVTHTVRLGSVIALERHLLIGLVGVPSFAAFLDLVLGMIATQPPTTA